MKYASVCSGVEAASLAWMPLGWEAVWFSEIEPFPCAVLKERFPSVPNLGDMTKIKVENLENGDQRYTNGLGADVFVPGGVDLLVGGTPCQSFSVAGKREGLDGASGLAKTFVELLGAMRPRWFVWENVPGCLSSKSNTGIYDFNFLLAAFAECGYSLGWRILDAQYVRVDGYPRAVPQRRRRVFVVGHLGKQWEYPAEVLFEFQSLFGNPAPRRIKAKNLTANVERSVGEASTVRMRAGCDGGGKGALISNELSLTLAAAGNAQTDSDHVTCVVSIGNGQVDGLINKPELAQTLNCMHDTQAIMCYENHANDSRIGTGGGNLQLVQEYYKWHSQALTANKITDDVAPTIPAAMGMGGTSMTTPVFVQEVFVKTARPTFKGGCETYADTGVAPTVNTFDQGDNRANELVVSKNDQQSPTVRRLLPIECERLMGFPDNHTRIAWKGKPAEDCPDSPRYKACGNSMCVNVMRWIGMRIDRVDKMESEND